MLHHLSFSVSDIHRSTAFYDLVLGVLGYRRVWTDEDAVGYGTEEGNDIFALKKRTPVVSAPSPGFHLAFLATSRQHVDAFHKVALEAGGMDNGAPGLRPHYGQDYYAAFIIDPDGYCIEAVNVPRTKTQGSDSVP
jgi:catechol 2,3-dioxygenase-like lactoylglutathione lyase family enzyme